MGIPYLIIHDDFVCQSVEYGRLSKMIFLGILVLFLSRELHVVGSKSVQCGHLITLVTLILDISVYIQHTNNSIRV